MPSEKGKKGSGRFYIYNESKDFTVPYQNFKIEEETSRLIDTLRMETGRNDRLRVGDEITVFDRAQIKTSGIDDFEDGDVSEWFVFTGTGDTFEASSSDPISGTYSLYQQGDDSLGQLMIPTDGAYRMKIRPESITQRYVISLSNSGDIFGGGLVLRSDGFYWQDDNSNETKLRDLTLGETYEIRFQFADDFSSVDIAINGVYYTNLSFYGLETDVLSIGYRNDGSGNTFEAWTDDIEVAEDTKVFGGYMVSKDEKNGTWELEADEYVKEVVDTRVKKVYRDMSPEDILQDLIENNTNLSFNAPVSSGITLDKFTVEGPIEEAIKDITDILDWQFRTTPQKETYLEPRGRIDSGKDFTHSENCVVTSKKTKDSKFINTVELRAGRTNYTRSNTFTGDGSSTEFTLTEVPVGSVEVSIDGTDQDGAIAESLESGDDFFIDTDQPALVFDTAPANNANIDINYTYEVPILVEAEASNAPIPPTEREVSTSIKRKWIKTFADAREYAKNYVRNHSRLIGSVKFNTNFTQEPAVGKLVDVTDDSKNVDQKFTVETKTIKHTGEMEIKAGQPDFNAIEWRNAVQRRIKQMQQSNTTNKTLSKYEVFESDLNLNLTSSITIKKREVNDSYILGSSSNGVLNEDLLGDRRGSLQTVVDTS